MKLFHKLMQNIYHKDSIILTLCSIKKTIIGEIQLLYVNVGKILI